MRKSVLISGAMHIGVIGATLITWPAIFDVGTESPPILPVELVTVTDTTNIRPAMREEPEPLREVEPPPAPEIAAQEEIPMAEVPEPEPEPPPPEPEPEPEPEEVAEEETPPPPPRPRPEPERPNQFDLDSVLALLDQREQEAPAPQAPQAETTVRGIGAQNALTMDVRDALLAQMRECWNVPVGAPNPEELVVHVRVFLSPNGELARAPQLMPETRAAASTNAYIRTAAEAALRAVNVCEPYINLPAERYDTWREIVMTFDPSRMAGR